MTAKRIIDIEKWNRKEHFRFFSALDDPFFGVTSAVDFTRAVQAGKGTALPFFLHSLHFILDCANRLEPFRLRIENGEAVCYDTIHASPTIGRDDGTFGFGFFEYDPDPEVFAAAAEREIARVKNGTGLSRNAAAARNDVIRYSALPWFAFTEMKHAGSFGTGDSVPRISTGRLTRDGDRYMLPVSVTVNHALMDGIDVARLFALLSEGPAAR